MEVRVFGENLLQLSSLNTCPMGVSPDSVECHRRFLDKLGLRLTLLPIPGKPQRQYTGTFLGLTKRKSFLMAALMSCTFTARSSAPRM